MVRRIENARERFGKAALELFRTRGYADTTVPQIAAAADLTERTFFRYFIDKPEVLFWRASELEAEIVETVARSSRSGPLDAVMDALEAAGRFFDDNRLDVIARQAIVESHADFQERELMKMRSLAASIRTVLRGRGLDDPTAQMVAEAGVLIWRSAIDRWSKAEPPLGFPSQLRACRSKLRSAMCD